MGRAQIKIVSGIGFHKNQSIPIYDIHLNVINKN